MINDSYSDNSKLYFPKKGGPTTGIKFAIQTNDWKRISKHFFHNPINLVIHDSRMVADFDEGLIELNPGYKSTIIVSTSEIKTTEPLLEYSKQRRNCRHENETMGLRILEKYSKSGCIFECRLGIALDFCGCSPWDYPRLNETVRICDNMGSVCFEKVMEEVDTEEDCSFCMDDCNILRYSNGHRKSHTQKTHTL